MRRLQINQPPTNPPPSVLCILSVFTLQYQYKYTISFVSLPLPLLLFSYARVWNVIATITLGREGTHPRSTGAHIRVRPTIRRAAATSKIPPACPPALLAVYSLPSLCDIAREHARIHHITENSSP